MAVASLQHLCSFVQRKISRVGGGQMSQVAK
jgi:hypothetical protein